MANVLSNPSTTADSNLSIRPTVNMGLECQDQTPCRIYVTFRNRSLVFSGGPILSDLYLAYNSALEIIYSAIDELGLTMDDITIALDDALTKFLSDWLQERSIPEPRVFNIETFFFASSMHERQVITA